MALGIGTDGLITLGRQGTGDGVITTDIGTTVTTGMITDGGGKLRNVSQFRRTAVCVVRRVSLHACLFRWRQQCNRLREILRPVTSYGLIRVHDATGNVIQPHEHPDDFKEC